MAYEESKRAHYERNKVRYIAQAKSRRKYMREIVTEAKSVPCADCGVQYPPYVMDFDHRDPELKVDFVPRLAQRGNEPLLREEIAKCDVVCSNCHRIRTHNRVHGAIA